ncbi:viperin family antiviral radical SAM protein [Pyxidicoccus xibeiensis]|uniref:viperin family antiviral radical SAM protein n=1 Tax=Pyxidicoccus xibeiensis TaxID=2906759 RepID=UPI0020A7CE5B|nr:viperin family antiviral radical SAM protein [Pyxidicoccus xibeiensis]MCP3138134.1 viperin family antiviral radical SAM protein [Pyxidicoccus xibeiensis]
MHQPTVDDPTLSPFERRLASRTPNASGGSIPSGSNRTSQQHELPPSVNFHLWEPCNMRCRFCFATFQDVRAQVLPRGHLPKEAALRIVEMLCSHFQKITFAGGEPLLCPWLPELVQIAKERGATTMVVTNGSQLTPERIARLKGALDWVTLSIDSPFPATHVAMGRAVQGRAIDPEVYIATADRIRQAGMRFKVNTVVTSLNAGEDQGAFLRALRPERWKMLRVLPVEGQNSGKVDSLLCSDEDFRGFVARHQGLAAHGIALIPEDNEDMRGSYAMVDPAGRFFDNAGGGHRYSGPILEAGIERAWSQVHFEMARFDQRGGRYDFGGGR